jgi:shikimate dehydrogenase
VRVSEFVGILGWPVAHSLSPAIHGAAFRSLGLDWVYLRFDVQPPSLGAAVAGLRALGAVGANVTRPHKETDIEHLDDLSGDAHAIAAVNTIQRLGDRLIGHNTDVDGFVRMVDEDAGMDVSGARCLVLGAGGASRAVVTGLARLRVGTVTVAARNILRAESVASVGADGIVTVKAWEEAVAALADYDVIVNATPLGMSGEAAVAREGALTSSHVVFDLVYDPPTTPLMRSTRAAGGLAWSGLGMLVHQAAATFKIWTGVEPPIEAMSAAALHALARRGSDDLPR